MTIPWYCGRLALNGVKNCIDTKGHNNQFFHLAASRGQADPVKRSDRQTERKNLRNIPRPTQRNPHLCAIKLELGQHGPRVRQALKRQAVRGVGRSLEEQLQTTLAGETEERNTNGCR